MAREIDASWRDNPTCPHCGYVETDTYDMDHSDGAETEMECGSCLKSYEVRTDVMIRWTSRKIEGEWP
jgi:transcription elongation factor Elf1